MNREHRVRIVRAIYVGAFFLFAAFIGIPIITAMIWLAPDQSKPDTELMIQLFRYANVSNIASLIALVLSGVCFLYAFGKWFIGPEDNSPESDE